MAQDQVEEIKQKTDIVSLIGEYIDLKKAGRNYKALCPFHGEKTPSFMVSPELQIFKCFGCSESGDGYTFLQKYEGMDFPEALKFLAERTGVKLKPTRFEDRGEKQRLYEINNWASKFYHYILLKHAAGRPALSYLIKERGLRVNTIKKFQLGYSPEASAAITKFLVGKKGFNNRDLEKAGIVYSKGRDVFDRFRGRVIFPLYDHRGNVSGFAGRVLPGREIPDVGKYINSPETPIYHKAKLLYGLNLTRGDIKKSKEAVVVEGELDAISSWQAGIKNVAAIKGSALTEDQGRLLRRFAERAVLALDTDLAGDTAARRGITTAEAAGLEIRVARLGKFKDPDEAARKDPAKFKKAIQKAVGVWDFIVDSVFSKHDIKDGSGKARLSREIIPILRSINDSIVQAHYVEVVAKRLGVPTSAVVGQVAKAGPSTKPNAKIELKPKPEKDRRRLLEERLVSLAFSLDPEILLEKETFGLIQTSLARRILRKYRSYAKTSKEFNPSGFAEGLPKELVDGFAAMIMGDSLNFKISVSAQKKELALVKRELQFLDIKDQLEDIAEKIKDYEKKGEKSKLKKAEQEFSKLTETLSSLDEVASSGIIL